MVKRKRSAGTRKPKLAPSTSEEPAAVGHGVEYAPGIPGKHTFRIRESHVAEHLVPLMSRRSIGAAKLDIVLRGIALLPDHAGKRAPGLVLPRHSYEALHDLVRAQDRYATSTSLGAPYDVEGARAKRKWVGEQLEQLEAMGLVRRELRPGKRPLIFVLRDDGSGEPFDDPDGSDGNSYVSVLGNVIASPWYAIWTVPELSFYLAAMIAERYANARASSRAAVGGGQWFQPLKWFADAERRRPPNHVRVPFAVKTLERGLSKLKHGGLVEVTKTVVRPDGKGRFKYPRNVYTNHFDTLSREDLPSPAIDAMSPEGATT